MPKILLIMPTWNQSSTIEKTLDSIMKQTYTDWHLTIVDDGSEDSTKEIVTDFIYKVAKLPPKQRRSVQFYSIPHKNASSALNHGFAYSEWVEAEYETWISSDNLYYPEFLKTLVDKLDHNPKVDFVYSDFDIIDSQGQILYTAHKKPYSKQRLESSYEQGMCFMWRKKLREKAGYWFDERLQCEDYNMILRMSNHGDFLWICRILGAFRMHKDQRGTEGIDKHSLEAKKFYFLWREGKPEGIPECHLVKRKEER